MNAAPVKPLLADQRWVSASIPARRPLYRLTASLHGFTVEACVHPQGTKGYCCAVLVDRVHAPGSPAGNLPTLEVAIQRAKDGFAKWTTELLERV
jgi:hypothetical protein